MLIGCGNSNLGFDMWLDGFTNIDCIDYAQSVIDRMNQKYREHPEADRLYSELRFHCMDMMDMKFENEIFDFVIDKATMDVILTDNKDPWNPCPHIFEKSAQVQNECIRVLKPKSVFISISFDQPHFRKKLLMSEAFVEKWSISQKNIPHGLGYFMYILTKNK